MPQARKQTNQYTNLVPMSSSNILFPSDLEDRILYYENDHVDDKITHFGGLFNSLYPYDWYKLIRYNTLQLQLTFSGVLDTIECILHHDNQRAEVIYKKSLEYERLEASIELPDFKPIAGQRISVRIKHTISDTKIKSARWQSIQSQQPKDISITIVICTHNNEHLLTDNVRNLLKSDVWADEKLSLIVVNNGELSDSFCHEYGNQIQILNQSNLGGSGGFGRGIYEIIYTSENREQPSHILLMDDDIRFDPEIIQRTIGLYKYASDEICIGGSMLKLEEPTYLHEAGSNIRSSKSIGTQTTITKGLLKQTGALEQLGWANTHDYNAWWFSSFPRKAVLKAGLPLPLFIHGDDIEYGLRLNNNGYKLYCPGGISLWHECFENKHATWIKYFDYRNAFIRLTQQAGNTPRTIKIQLNRIFKRCIIRNDYGSCAMLIEAFRDFCSGPDILLDRSFDDKIQSLKLKFMEHSNLPTTGRYRLSGDSNILSAFGRIRKYTKYLTSNLHYAPISSVGLWETNNTRYLWSEVPYLHDIRVKIKDEQYFNYTRCRKTAKELSQELKELTQKFIKNKSECFFKWQDSIDDFTTPSFWRKYITSKSNP